MKKTHTILAAALWALILSGATREAGAQSTSRMEAQQAREQVTSLLGKVRTALDRAGGNPRVFVDSLPAEVRNGNEEVYEAILGLQPGERAARFRSKQPWGPVRKVFQRQARELAGRYSPGESAVSLESEALAAEATAGPFFRGHFLHPDLPPPYGKFTPNCENHWCVPDLYIGDYDEADLDGRRGNFCSLVPDFWFRWPCYQHDIAYAFAPKAADSKLGSFLAVNWQWYGDMRTECHERVRFDWLNPEFILCQAVAFTYYIGVNTFAFPVFNTPNEIKGYDVLEGEDPDPSHPPVFRRWSACTGKYTQSGPFVSYQRKVLGSYAEVPRGAVLELSGRTHRGTRILFEFADETGRTVANHLTGKSGDNCIIPQEPEAFSTGVLPPGIYTVKAHYYAWEGSGQVVDESYDPPRAVAYGTPVSGEKVMILNLTGW